MGSRPPDSDHGHFCCKFGFGKSFGASSRSSHWAGHRQLSCKIYFLSYVTVQSKNGSLLLHRIRKDNTSKWQFFWFLVTSWGTHLLRFFKTFPFCFKCQTTVEWSTLSFWTTSQVRDQLTVSFNDCSPWVIVNFWWLATVLPIFKALVSFAKFPVPPLQCTFVSSSWAKRTDVVSFLCCFMTHFKLE